MVRIAITQAAFDAICGTLPHGSVGYENEANERGEKLIWLDHAVVSRAQDHARAGRECAKVRVHPPPSMRAL